MSTKGYEIVIRGFIVADPNDIDTMVSATKALHELQAGPLLAELGVTEREVKVKFVNSRTRAVEQPALPLAAAEGGLDIPAAAGVAAGPAQMQAIADAVKAAG